MSARQTGKRGINFRQTVHTTTGLALGCSQKHRQTGLMMLVVVNEDRHQNRGVQKEPHFGLPRKRCSRSRRICRMVFSTTSAESGTPVFITQTPCFLYIRPCP